MSHNPWPHMYIMNPGPTRIEVERLNATIADAIDERPVQEILATAPALWRPLLPSPVDVWCFDRPAFGSEYVPDFLLCYRNSTGFNWLLVELESPTKPPLNQGGRIAVKLNDALGQIADWRIWIRNNISYAQHQLGFKGLDAECPALVVIGRRAMILPTNALRYRELSNGKTRVMTYDRLIEITMQNSTAQEWFHGQ